MAKGGARARSGPAPDPDALRRDRDGETWITLPTEGRQGDPPAWPLTEATEREMTLWTREWKRPQAVMWERNGQEEEVAIYVRAFTAAEARDASVNSRTLLRQLQESLGLSLPGLARNHWRIEGATSSPVPQRKRRTASSSAKTRFRVLDGGEPS